MNLLQYWLIYCVFFNNWKIKIYQKNELHSEKSFQWLLERQLRKIKQKTAVFYFEKCGMTKGLKNTQKITIFYE